MRTCWCGSTKLSYFSEEYSNCLECGTLVSQKSLSDDQLQVKNDDIDFYGKQYWLDHQKQDLGFPNIHERARNDLTERNLHWLSTLLKYNLPPARVLELGCSHGSFVALMRQVGYDASGVEMSPWVVEFGRKAFDIPISIGPVEALEIPCGSIDVIALMDVLEHLPDPVKTMKHCLQLLKPKGILLLQTPQFKQGMNYPELIEKNGAFLEQLKSDEHLYLFSKHSVTQLFQHLGAESIQFEPAIFSHYDMFFVVSRTPLEINAPELIESALLSRPGSRQTLALLDIYKKNHALQKFNDELSANRDSILSQLHTLTDKVQNLTRVMERKPVKFALAVSRIFGRLLNSTGKND